MRNKEVFDISSVGYVKRIVIGNNNPEKATDERTIQKQIDLLKNITCNSDSKNMHY